MSDDTVVVFWSKGDPNAVDLFADSVGLGEPAAVESLFRATWKGRPVDLHDPAAFYALTITGNRGRATIRSWQEERLGDVLRRVRQYFEDIEIAGRDRERPRPLLRLVASLGVQNKLENAPSELAADLFAAALGDRPFPIYVKERGILAYEQQRAYQAVQAEPGDRPNEAARRWMAFEPIPMPDPAVPNALPAHAAKGNPWNLTRTDRTPVSRNKNPYCSRSTPRAT